MSYLKRLIERAVDKEKLENNKIGSYRIQPRHGYNLYVYDISLEKNGREDIILTIKIDVFMKRIRIFGFTSDTKIINDCFKTLVKLYPEYDIDSFYSKLKKIYEGTIIGV